MKNAMSDSFKREFLEGVAASFGKGAPSVELLQKCPSTSPWERSLFHKNFYYEEKEWYKPELTAQEMGKLWGEMIQGEFVRAFRANLPEDCPIDTEERQQWEKPWVYRSPEEWFEPEKFMYEMGDGFAERYYYEKLDPRLKAEKNNDDTSDENSCRLS